MTQADQREGNQLRDTQSREENADYTDWSVTYIA